MNEDMLTTTQVADLIGVKPGSVRYMVSHDRMPKPDGHFGRTPWWNRDTITTWQAERSGQGWRKGQKKPDSERKPRPNYRLKALEAEAEAQRLRDELEQLKAATNT